MLEPHRACLVLVWIKASLDIELTFSVNVC